jgi:hypothetical protein
MPWVRCIYYGKKFVTLEILSLATLLKVLGIVILTLLNNWFWGPG